MHINSGRPWTDAEIHELQEALAWGRRVADVADYLCRDLFEVVTKMNELGVFRSNVRRLNDRRRVNESEAGSEGQRSTRTREEGSR